MKRERADFETEARQRQVAADYFIDLTDALTKTLQDFCDTSALLIPDGNSPSINARQTTPELTFSLWH